jgi:hypothetical protein
MRERKRERETLRERERERERVEADQAKDSEDRRQGARMKCVDLGINSLHEHYGLFSALE